VPTIFFITNPDVAIDPNVPVPDWPLNEPGRARVRAMTSHSWIRHVRRIFASSERKARDAAQILANGLRLSGYTVIDALGFARERHPCTKMIDPARKLLWIGINT